MTAPLGPLADVFDGAAGAFADVLDRLAGTLADLADAFAGALAHLLERLADAFEQLRVAIERGQDAIDDRGHVVEAGPQQGLRFDAFDVQLDFAELDMNADAQLDQVEDLGVQRDASLEVVQLEVDLIDLDDRHVDDDIGLVGVADFPWVHEGVVLVHRAPAASSRRPDCGPGSCCAPGRRQPWLCFLPWLSFLAVGLLLRPRPLELFRSPFLRFVCCAISTPRSLALVYRSFLRLFP